jgi:glucosylceramidase
MDMSEQSIRVFCTARDTGERIAERSSIEPGDSVDYSVPSVMVDCTKRFQEIEGFGGAFTEAAAATLHKMSPEVQEEILRAYFDPQAGHRYTLCRTHINSCDFSLGNYAYTEVEGDTDLAHFSIDRDRRDLIPMIQAARAIAGSELRLFASPWSPPAWMKTTGEMNRGGKLRPECREAWARYYCRYIREYESEGIPIWGLTVQNEPEATQRWDSCIYTAEEERDFVRDHLGPALHKEGLADVKLIIWDHNRDRIFERAKVVYDDPEAAKYVWGTGFHWYCDDKFDNIGIVHEAWPNKKLLFTEGCQEQGPHVGSWDLGERYARSILSDLNSWTVGWTDWNLLLDETGGPNHVGNLCSAPIIADTRSGEVHYQSSYYYLGHFSRFIRPGARRVACATTLDALEATAFVNPDGSLALVVLNRTDEALSFAVKLASGAAMTESPARSIVTFLARA